ncbi:MAG: minichromosome maintenance protein MCM [Candidatus Aenigmatarchaeota archaeon]|nr:minichromosome maintenance protein MCM [Nanoarchaeota archaeon]
MAYLIEERRDEFVAKIKEFLLERYKKELDEASQNGEPLIVDFDLIQKFGKYGPELSDALIYNPQKFFDFAKEAIEQVDLDNPVKLRISNLSEMTSIRDLRSKHINKFISVEGIVRKASEIRPEIMETIWECPECGEKISVYRKGNFMGKPMICTGVFGGKPCRNRMGFTETGKKMIDTRWLVIEEPFELTEGERPAQVTIVLTEDLVSPDGRRITEPGNKLKLTGILKDIPKAQAHGVKLDFFLEANHAIPTEIGWEKLDISREDEDKIKELAKKPEIYDIIRESISPSLYGLKTEKESIMLQLFGGVRRILKDGTRIRGDIHLLFIGDPASGKSQLLKLVPQMVPRGKYVSGKGVTAAGLTASVTKDEQFMGGWVLEAGAMVLANKGLIAIDEFEKMSNEDQVAMHEALEQGSISIAKASIVATLPAETSVLAGGNPKFSRFDPYMAISKQITIPPTLLSRFDLKFALRDIPDPATDRLIVEHILKAKDMDDEANIPLMSREFMKKYIAYTKDKIKPEMTKEVGKLLKNFYIRSREKATGEGNTIPMSLRQFEAMIRLSEASAKIQLSHIVRKQDAERAMRLMEYSLKQLGYDPETGEIDVDRAEGVTTSSERNQIRIVMDIINSLSAKKKEIPLGELEELAKKEGVKDPEEVIEKLKREGMLFEPTPGYLQKV